MPQIAPILGNIAINLAITVGASLLSSLIKPKAAARSTATEAPRGFAFDMQVGESVPVSGVFGLARPDGQLIYVNEYGTGADYHLQMVIRIGYGWHDGLEKGLVDEKVISFAGLNSDPKGRSVVEYTVGGVPYLWFKAYTGAPGQAADAELIARAEPAGRWTAAHKGTGVAYMIVTVRNNPDLFPGTLPRFGSVWRGLRLYDWRQPGAVWGDQSTYVFSKNPAVIRYNYRRGIYANGQRVLGMGLSSYANDLTYYTACANVCDEPIYYPETDETMPRYEFGREVGDDESKLTVLQQLDASYCGSSFKRGGADAPIPAQQLVSMMTLSDRDRLLKADGKPYPVRADRKGSVSQKRTMFHGQFVSADVGYGLAPFSPRIDTVLESVLGGRKSTALDQPYEERQERAQYRAETALRRQFYPATRVETFGPMALVLEPGDAVTRICEWGSMLMVVEKVAQLEDRTGATVTMTEWSNTIVPASGETFVTLPTEPGAGPVDANRTIAVSGLHISPFSRTGGGAVHPYGRATWTPITDPNVDQVMIRLWPSDGTEADDHEDFFAASDLTSTKLVGPLQPLTEYTYKAIPIRADGRVCVWSNTGTFTTGAETTPTEVLDGSITPAKLAQELQNERGFLVGAGEGTLAERLIELQRLQEQAALAALTDQTTRVETYKITKAQNAASLAAISETRRVVAEGDRALAELIDEVAVEIAENLTAGGLFQITGVVDGVGGTARADILMKVRAQVADAFAEAAFRLVAEADGLGGSLSYIDIMADRLRFIATNGDAVTIPFKIETIDGVSTVVVQSMRFRDLKSLDGVSIIINGVDPEITITGP